MGVSGRQQRALIKIIVDLFGEDARDFVFVGSCVLGLYATTETAHFRITKDIDVISIVTPWSLQQKRLSDLCQQGVLVPDPKLACRYYVAPQNPLVPQELVIDVLSPEGRNVGGVNRWFEPAAKRAGLYTLDDGTQVHAVTPAYFLATKLEAWMNRGVTPQEDTDADDIVAVALEVVDLAEQLRAENIHAEVASMFVRALAKYDLTIDHLRDLVSYHLHPLDAAEEDRVVETLVRCARGE